MLVQTISDVEETREIMEIAGTTGLVGDGVGGVDLTDPQAAYVLHELIAGPHGSYLVGMFTNPCYIQPGTLGAGSFVERRGPLRATGRVVCQATQDSAATMRCPKHRKAGRRQWRQTELTGGMPESSVRKLGP